MGLGGQTFMMRVTNYSNVFDIVFDVNPGDLPNNTWVQVYIYAHIYTYYIY